MAQVKAPRHLPILQAVEQGTDLAELELTPSVCAHVMATWQVQRLRTVVFRPARGIDSKKAFFIQDEAAAAVASGDTQFAILLSDGSRWRRQQVSGGILVGVTISSDLASFARCGSCHSLALVAFA